MLLSVEIGLSPQALFFNVLFSVEFDLFSSQPTLFVCAFVGTCMCVGGWVMVVGGLVSRGTYLLCSLLSLTTDPRYQVSYVKHSDLH